MTPTEQDEELRKKISKMCEGIAAGYHGEDGIDYIMQLITADRKRVELEARIDETRTNIQAHYVHKDKYEEWAYKREDELKAQQEEVR